MPLRKQVETSDPVGQTLAGQFTDVNTVEKFELTPEEYEARAGECLLTLPAVSQQPLFG